MENVETVNNQEVDTNISQEVVDTKTEKEETTTEFTKEQQEQINKIISARVAKERSKAIEEYKQQQEQEKSQAKKLAKMTDEEKYQHKLNEQQKQIEEQQQKIARFEMEQVATNILAEQGITPSKDILDFVCREDADKTNQAITTLVSLINKSAEKLLQERNKGSVPTRQTSTAKEERWKQFTR